MCTLLRDAFDFVSKNISEFGPIWSTSCLIFFMILYTRAAQAPGWYKSAPFAAVSANRCSFIYPLNLKWSLNKNLFQIMYKKQAILTSLVICACAVGLLGNTDWEPHWETARWGRLDFSGVGSKSSPLQSCVGDWMLVVVFYSCSDQILCLIFLLVEKTSKHPYPKKKWIPCSTKLFWAFYLKHLYKF